MKRKHTVCYNSVALCTRSKKPRLWPQTLLSRRSRISWIAATKTRNFMLNDPLVDWLKVHGSNPKSGGRPKDGFASFIMEKGLEFEDALVKHIHRYKIPVVSVSEYITNDSINKTVSLMKSGTPIIHSAPVRNSKNKTHGIIDFLVRSDYLYKLIDDCPLTSEEMVIPAPLLGSDYHYVVIDVKFSTLPLRADGKHLFNSGSYPAYKAQCYIYNQAVGIIQGYTPRYAYILGRRWRYKSKDIKYNNYTCLNRLGVIDYQKVDKQYITRTKDALSWLRDNERYGHQWSVSPPTRRELYPNMCHDSGKWQKHKEKISKDIGEISSIWYCGVKHRETALDNGIHSWRDPECNSETMGMRGMRAPIIDSILDINRQSTDLIRPKKIRNNICKWKQVTNEMFVDFETLSDIFCGFDDLPNQKTTDMIFMIGVWYKPLQSCEKIVKQTCQPSKWTYKRFTCARPTYEEEYRIMKEFVEFVKSQDNPKLWYWCAENKFWTRSENRQFNRVQTDDDETKSNRISDEWNLNNWADLCEVFKHEPIVIKNCFKFGLKQISSAMREHGLIKTKIESECSSGMTAMIKAWKCYQDFSDPINCPIMQDIAKYNKFDCCVLEEILTYLRKNHT